MLSREELNDLNKGITTPGRSGYSASSSWEELNDLNKGITTWPAGIPTIPFPALKN